MFEIKNLSKRKKITITSIVAINTQSPDEAEELEEDVKEADTSEKPQEAVADAKNETETINTTQVATKPIAPLTRHLILNQVIQVAQQK